MALTPGTRLGAYEIVALLGAGGMGEVYRARDTRLNREVAIKILPDQFAADAERVARFQREAQVLASLNHPNIAHIHGLEEADGVRALVLELVEGPTLADRIAQGPVPLDEALPIARQIAEALEAAHEHGIIHRDLKPANIKLPEDGTVKVLDFGLAKALSNETPAANLSMSPTITSPALMTGGGVILGTAAYMSPEQARGKAVDKRTDIWAFGGVLYEMLTGQRAFGGNDVTESLAFIITKEPDWNALPANTPPSVARLLRRSLEKDRKRRLPDIGTARLEIDEALAAPSGSASTTAPPSAVRTRERLLWIVAAALIAALTAAVVTSSRPSSTHAPQLVHASIPLEQPLELWRQQSSLIISPDGTRVVYRPLGDGPLYSRLLNQGQGSAIPGTERASNPLVSPDGQWLAFFVGPQLKKLSLAGGTVVTIGTLPFTVGTVGYRGATWGEDGTIVFAPSTGAGLFRVSDQGGDVQPLTSVDQKKGETSHRWPHLLPGGKAVIFTVKTTGLQSFDDSQIVARSLETGEQHVLAQGAYAVYVATGHLVYARAGALFAVPFDAGRLEVTGAPVKVVDGVVTFPESGAAQFAISRSGSLVYAAGDSHTAERPLLWVDRRGDARPLGDRPAQFMSPRISPDGRRIAMFINAAYGRLWVLDVPRGAFTRVSQLGGDQDSPLWTPDGSRVTFSADVTGTGVHRIFSESIDGSGTAEPLFDSPQTATPMAWSPDGRSLMYLQTGATTGQDLWIYSMDTRKSTPFLQSRANEFSAAFSPNGRWVAYASDESGRSEVHVRPFPGPGARLQISTNGGTTPVWSPAGRELFYSKENTLFVVPVGVDGTFTGGAARPLFSGPYDFGEFYRHYDVAPDGQHFVVPRSRVDSAPRQIDLVLNWFEELKQRVPLK